MNTYCCRDTCSLHQYDLSHKEKNNRLKHYFKFPCFKIIPSCLIIITALQSGGSYRSLWWHNCFHEFSKEHWCKVLEAKRGRKAAISSGKKAHKTNIWLWQSFKLRKVNVKNRCSAVSHCYFFVIIPRCWCILSSSLAVYHIRDSNEIENLKKAIT